MCGLEGPEILLQKMEISRELCVIDLGVTYQSYRGNIHVEKSKSTGKITAEDDLHEALRGPCIIM